MTSTTTMNGWYIALIVALLTLLVLGTVAKIHDWYRQRNVIMMQDFDTIINTTELFPIQRTRLLNNSFGRPINRENFYLVNVFLDYNPLPLMAPTIIIDLGWRFGKRPGSQNETFSEEVLRQHRETENQIEQRANHQHAEIIRRVHHQVRNGEIQGIATRQVHVEFNIREDEEIFEFFNNFNNFGNSNDDTMNRTLSQIQDSNIHRLQLSRRPRANPAPLTKDQLDRMFPATPYYLAVEYLMENGQIPTENLDLNSEDNDNNNNVNGDDNNNTRNNNNNSHTGNNELEFNENNENVPANESHENTVLENSSETKNNSEEEEKEEDKSLEDNNRNENDHINNSNQKNSSGNNIVTESNSSVPNLSEISQSDDNRENETCDNNETDSNFNHNNHHNNEDISSTTRTTDFPHLPRLRNQICAICQFNMGIPDEEDNDDSPNFNDNNNNQNERNNNNNDDENNDLEVESNLDTFTSPLASSSSSSLPSSSTTTPTTTEPTTTTTEATPEEILIINKQKRKERRQQRRLKRQQQQLQQQGINWRNNQVVKKEEELVRILSCFHVFHDECIATWLTKSSAHCPLCKVDFTREIPNR